MNLELQKKSILHQKEKAEDEEFNLSDYKIFRPLSKLKTSNEIKNQNCRIYKKIFY